MASLRTGYELVLMAVVSFGVASCDRRTNGKKPTQGLVDYEATALEAKLEDCLKWCEGNRGSLPDSGALRWCDKHVHASHRQCEASCRRRRKLLGAWLSGARLEVKGGIIVVDGKGVVPSLSSVERRASRLVHYLQAIR